jgi:hypothetical protein
MGMKSDHSLVIAASKGFSQLEHDLHVDYGFGHDTDKKKDHTQIVAHVTSRYTHVTFLHRPDLERRVDTTLSISQTPAGASVHVIERKGDLAVKNPEPEAGPGTGKRSELPKLDGKSGKGLKIECRLTKVQFAVGEAVNVWCTVTNTTDSIKSIGWHSNTGEHFCLVERDRATREGVLPRAYPQLRSAIMIKSKVMHPGYILFLPPRESIQVLLTYEAERPEKFKGRIVYDPVAPREGRVVTDGEEDGPPWKGEWVCSNELEYEVIEGGK